MDYVASTTFVTPWLRKTDMVTPLRANYETLNDPEALYAPTKRDMRRQADAEHIRERAQAIAQEAPPLSPGQVNRIAAILFGSKRDRRDLMTWRLRLICGHVVERTAHAAHTTIAGAFGSSVYSCHECGLSPSVIVAGRALNCGE